MATKQTLLIVHGMGKHTEKSFEDEVIASLDFALGLYPGLKDKKTRDLIEIVPFEYDSIFNKYRAKMADARKKFAARLDALESEDLHPVRGGFLAWEKDIDGDSFFKTHWLDVLFYRYTFLAEPARIKLSRRIIETVNNVGAENVHVLGHSLGTSLVHDTLASLYKPYETHKREQNLEPAVHRLGSVHLIANVSRLLQSFVGVDKSIVRPSGGGCTHIYYQYCHAVDPFTWPSAFEPLPNEHWSAAAIGDPGRYRALTPTAVTDLNTHAITHYLRDPLCHGPLLQTLQIDLAEKDIQKASVAYGAGSIQGKAEEMRDRWKRLELDRLEDVPAFIKAARELRDYLANFGQTLKE